ncbi:SMEK domain-containing protein [Flavitalea antarctica]
MSLDPYASLIARKLVLISDLITVNNNGNLHDAAIHAETLFCEILNIIFPFQLVNNNDQKSNADTIDLRDDAAKVAFQITSTKAHQAKFRSFIEAILKKELYKTYDHFCLLFIGRVDKKYLKYRKEQEYNYEGFDIDKLIMKINQHPVIEDRRRIHEILNEFYPDIWPNAQVNTNTKLLRTTSKLYSDTALAIRRNNLLSELFTFCQQKWTNYWSPRCGKKFLSATTESLLLGYRPYLRHDKDR